MPQYAHHRQRVMVRGVGPGRTVSAVIREAIDLRFGEDFEVRAEAAARLLAVAGTGRGDEPDWSETKASFERDLERHDRDVNQT